MVYRDNSEKRTPSTNTLKLFRSSWERNSNWDAYQIIFSLFNFRGFKRNLIYKTKKSSVVASSTPHSHASPNQIYIQNALNKLTLRHAGRCQSGVSKTNLSNGRCGKIEK